MTFEYVPTKGIVVDNARNLSLGEILKPREIGEVYFSFTEARESPVRQL
ncbi:MAG TPA: hypothetical protein VHN20_18730 [Beijerinckiaceae bacterium]|nr:hypothetical protein [Beijerinckiaceae bacterium]